MYIYPADYDAVNQEKEKEIRDDANVCIQIFKLLCDSTRGDELTLGVFYFKFNFKYI